MRPEDEDQIAAQLARVMAVACVRNTQLETLHAGPAPVSHARDGSDVVVVDAEGNRIPWSEVSRIDDAEMRALMREIVDRLYTFHLRVDDPAFRAEIDRWAAMTAKWDAPKPDPVLAAVPAETPERG
jgi:hypothetical protein